MALSWKEATARQSVTAFLKAFISAGSLTKLFSPNNQLPSRENGRENVEGETDILIEEDGTSLCFEGSLEICQLSVTLKVHNPQFYWKVAMEADLGFADAYINGDFSFVDKDNGLENVMMVVINGGNGNEKTSVILVEKSLDNLDGHIFLACTDYNASSANVNKRNWWASLFSITSWIGTAKFIYRHFRRQNTLTQARTNISKHYDLSNEMFSCFMDETMLYSCAVFKSENEDLEVAQMRKISLLIDKARVKEHHEVLETGFGWGTLAIEVVKRTGCKYTGITLSQEQLKFAEERVKKAGLQDRITFLLCDYRQLKDVHKYDRIFSCEMLESVGHEYIEEYFRCCESFLAPNGLFVLQFISIADECYDEFRKSPGFIKEYIFFGGCLPSFSRVISAMSTASKLCVEHVENIGDHYYQTLRLWRKNFLENKSKIISLGFDEKFFRTWEYYFDYCAAGFKMRTLGDYQVIFSRKGNVVAFDDPYEIIPSARCLS